MTYLRLLWWALKLLLIRRSQVKAIVHPAQAELDFMRCLCVSAGPVSRLMKRFQGTGTINGAGQYRFFIRSLFSAVG